MLVIILTTLLISRMNCECETDETLSAQHYLALGCTPVQKPNGEIQRFHCPDFELLDKEKCHYKGKMYNPSEFIEKEHLRSCVSGCFCFRRYGDDPAQFVCNYDFCPEQTAFFSEPCVLQHSLTNCCAENILCDKQQLKDLFKCHVDNQTYYEGEIMYPRNMCDKYKCICDKDYDKIDKKLNPKCKLIDEHCYIGLHQFNNYQAGCVPIYYGEYPKCNGDFRCPKENDRVIAGNIEDANSTDNVCKFGHLIFRKGDKLNDNCYNCTCIVPPLLFCRQYTNC